jgi:cyanophycin synthetase
VLAGHLAGGGKAAFIDRGKLVLAEGSRETVVVKAADIPATCGGLVTFQGMNALAAAAACWGAGVPVESIRLGLRTFRADDNAAPGRFNIFEVGRAKVIVDYGHNPHALRAMQQAVRAMDPRRAIGVVAAPGDRRDADIRELAEIAAQTFDRVIVREDDDTRGRERGEVSRLIADTIASTSPSLPVCVIVDEDESIKQALEMARAEDLVVIFADKVEAAIQTVKQAARAMSEMQEGEFVSQLPPDGSGVSGHSHTEASAYMTAQGIYPET